MKLHDYHNNRLSQLDSNNNDLLITFHTQHIKINSGILYFVLNSLVLTSVLKLFPQCSHLYVFSHMRPEVCLLITSERESPPTVVTLVWLLPHMCPPVPL